MTYDQPKEEENAVVVKNIVKQPHEKEAADGGKTGYRRVAKRPFIRMTVGKIGEEVTEEDSKQCKKNEQAGNAERNGNLRKQIVCMRRGLNRLQGIQGINATERRFSQTDSPHEAVGEQAIGALIDAEAVCDRAVGHVKNAEEARCDFGR